MRQRTQTRRPVRPAVTNRAKAHQEKRYVLREPMPEYFGIRRPLSEEYTAQFRCLFTRVISQLEQEVIKDNGEVEVMNLALEAKETKLSPALGLVAVKNPFINVFPKKKFPMMFAQGLRLGHELGVTGANAGLNPDLAGDNTVHASFDGMIDGLVFSPHRQGIDALVSAPGIMQQARTVHHRLGGLGINNLVHNNPDKTLPDVRKIRFQVIRSNHQIKDGELVDVRDLANDIVQTENMDLSLITFGSSEIYPESATNLSAYIR